MVQGIQWLTLARRSRSKLEDFLQDAKNRLVHSLSIITLLLLKVALSIGILLKLKNQLHDPNWNNTSNDLKWETPLTIHIQVGNRKVARSPRQSRDYMRLLWSWFHVPFYTWLSWKHYISCTLTISRHSNFSTFEDHHEIAQRRLICFQPQTIWSGKYVDFKQFCWISGKFRFFHSLYAKTYEQQQYSW